jgi:aminoglycoside phosphotransferase (APT) family kinase protein
MICNKIRESLSLKLGVDFTKLVIIKQLAGSNRVFKLKYNNSLYVLKVFEDKSLLDKELRAYILLSRNHCKCPELVNYDDILCNWILYHFVNGIALEKALKFYSVTQLRRVFEDFGNEVHNIHSVELNIESKDIEFRNNKIFKIENVFLDINRKKFFNEKKIICNAIMMVRNGYHLYDYYKTLSFIHNDLNSHNIIVQNTKVSSIIDYEQSSIGIIYSDFVCIKHLTLKRATLEKAFLNGYKITDFSTYNDFTNHFLLSDSLIYCNCSYLTKPSEFNYYFNIIKQTLKGYSHALASNFLRDKHN